MNIVQLTPGAGKMYCGNCFRDNALVKELRAQGHDTLMVPLYLPLTLDEEDTSAEVPIFFNGIRVYLEQKSSIFRRAPKFIYELLGARQFLKWAAGSAAKTKAADVGDLTISMLRGEEGNQSRELDELVNFLKSQGEADIVCLSNALLLGMVRKIKSEVHVPVVCMLQGEHAYVESMPAKLRDEVWAHMAERAQEVDLFIAPSRYFGELMREKLKVPAERVKVVYNGISLEGYAPKGEPPRVPVVGYFARMCRDKGLDTLVDAWLALKARNQAPEAQLWIGGGCGPSDEPFVKALKDKIAKAGWISHVRFFPNVTREEKLKFLHGLTVLSVPALPGEAFGLYLAEAMAAGIPVVQPRHSAFPEIVELSRAGELFETDDIEELSRILECLLMDRKRAREFAANARQAAETHFSIPNMAREVVKAFEGLGKPVPVSVG